MTPAITLDEKQGIAHSVHSYQHDPASESYGLEAAEKLDLDPLRVFKTLVVALDSGKLVVMLVPVSSMLSLKAAAKALTKRQGGYATAVADPQASGPSFHNVMASRSITSISACRCASSDVLPEARPVVVAANASECGGSGCA